MRDLAVVLPAYNEATLLPGVLAALAAQTDRDFTLVVVDNASTDDTAALAAAFPGEVEVVPEPSPGAGTAADTGFRHAIAGGATLLARTDADCLPAPDWVATARKLLTEADLVCGRSVPRHDERPNPVERHLYPAAVRLAARYGRRLHRAPEYAGPLLYNDHLEERVGRLGKRQRRDVSEYTGRRESLRDPRKLHSE